MARNVTQTITRGRHGESWGEEGNIECVISITWMGILELMLCHLWTCLLVTLPPSSACRLVGKLSYCCQCSAACECVECHRAPWWWPDDSVMQPSSSWSSSAISSWHMIAINNQPDQVSHWRHLTTPQWKSEWRLRNVTVGSQVPTLFSAMVG